MTETTQSRESARCHFESIPALLLTSCEILRLDTGSLTLPFLLHKAQAVPGSQDCCAKSTRYTQFLWLFHTKCCARPSRDWAPHHKESEGIHSRNWTGMWKAFIYLGTKHELPIIRFVHKCVLDPFRYRALGNTAGWGSRPDCSLQQGHKYWHVAEYGGCSENETDILWREEKITLKWGSVESGKPSLRRWPELGCPWKVDRAWTCRMYRDCYCSFNWLHPKILACERVEKMISQNGEQLCRTPGVWPLDHWRVTSPVSSLFSVSVMCESTYCTRGSQGG